MCSDALAKALYARLFEWLVGHVNKMIFKPGSKSFIGVLDIFGFENFKVRGYQHTLYIHTQKEIYREIESITFSHSLAYLSVYADVDVCVCVCVMGARR